MASALQHSFETVHEDNRKLISDWLEDRSRFHVWFTSLIVGSFVITWVFGEQPGFDSPAQTLQSIAMLLLLLSLLSNLVGVWSIPGWKYRINAKLLDSARNMRLQLEILAWIGVISFVCALTLGFISKMPA